jgi:putative protease
VSSNETSSLELVCPAGTPAALREAVEAGADAVYCGFRNETNARNFPGLNFSPSELREAIAFAHRHQAKVLVAINTFPRASDPAPWKDAVNCAAGLGADAVILADLGLLAYTAEEHPDLRVHLSVQAGATNAEAISFYVETFSVKRVVLPRVLSIPEIARLNRIVSCETEVFVFGGLCVMEEGRCSLSSYASGKSPNMSGVCSPASHVSYKEQDELFLSRLGEFTIDRVPKGEPLGYPTLCKGKFKTRLGTGHIFEDPVSLDAQLLLPELRRSGVSALKIEGRQRGRAYIRTVVGAFRKAVDALDRGETASGNELIGLAEGQSGTCGAYLKTWR